MPTEIELLANSRIDKVFGEYKKDDNSVILAAINLDDLYSGIFEFKSPPESQITKIINEILQKSETQSELKNDGSYKIEFPAGVVKRSVMVGLAAAAIGASVGASANDLHIVFVGIVGAESAVLLNVLSSLLIDEKSNKHQLDGLDLAVLSILEKGDYSAEEIRARISLNLQLKEVEKSIKKLHKFNKVQKGKWNKTYSIKNK